MSRIVFIAAIAATLALGAGTVEAQAQAGVEAGASVSGGGTVRSSRPSAVRLAIQARLDMLNMVGVTDAAVIGSFGGGGTFALIGQMAPYVAPGVRLVDNRLFLGLGLGFTAFVDSECMNPACDTETTTSRSGWTLSPLVSFDLLQRDEGALYLLGWFNLAGIGDSTVETVSPAGSMEFTSNDGAFGVGLNIGAGLRGNISESLGLGAEFGYGFLSFSDDEDDDSTTFHALFGTIFLEASIGL